MNDYRQINLVSLIIYLIPIAAYLFFYSLVYLAAPDKIISRFIKFLNRDLAKKEINKGLVIKDTALSRTMISILFFQIAFVFYFAIQTFVNYIGNTTVLNDSLTRGALFIIYIISGLTTLIYFLVATIKSIFFSLTMIFKKRRNQKIQNLKRR